MFCTECGFNNSDESMFCLSCGTKLEKVYRPADSASAFTMATDFDMPGDFDEPAGMAGYGMEMEPPGFDIGPEPITEPLPALPMEDEYAFLEEKPVRITKEKASEKKKVSILWIIIPFIIVLVLGLGIGLFIIFGTSGGDKDSDDRIESRDDDDEDDDDEDEDDAKSKKKKKDKESDEDDVNESKKDKDSNKDKDDDVKEELSDNDLAIEAYNKIISKAPKAEIDDDDFYDASFQKDDNINKYGEHIDYVALYDFDNDGVDELITKTFYNFKWYVIDVYKYENGKAEAFFSVDCYSGANGDYITYICGEGHIHNEWTGYNPMTGDNETETYVHEYAGTRFKDAYCDLELGSAGSTDTNGMLRSNDGRELR